MPLAVTHIIIPLVLSDIYRNYIAKKKFNIRYIFAAGVSGLIPDIDIFVAWIFNIFSFIPISSLHRTFTHTLFFPLIFVLLYFIFKNYNPKYLKKQKLKLNHLFLAVAFGIFTHIILDAIFSGPIEILPNLFFGFNLIPLQGFQGTFFQGLDAILLVLWLAHEEYKHRISDYI